MIDQEQMAQSRREIAEQRRAAAAAAATARNDQAPGGAAVATERLLAAMRAGDDLHQARRWLYVARSDRRPGSVAELQQVLAELAAADGATFEQVRAGIARALEVEGRTLADWEASLSTRRRPVLGRRQTRGIAS